MLILIACMVQGVHAMAHVERSEDSFWQSGFSSHGVGSGCQAQVARLGDRHLHRLSHPAIPHGGFIMGN